MYRCPNCRVAKSYPHDNCPRCGVWLSGVRCWKCSYVDARSAFIHNDHRCPYCGSRVAVGKEGCFIATAVYGSPSAPEVFTFRRFRDRVLLPSKSGRAFVRIYYIVSPSLAALISERQFLRIAARRVLLGPVLQILKAMADLQEREEQESRQAETVSL
jgi:hypothetical protein